jgi:sterol desaturase/sphingolipid hydroxylase (fatty acid hydroxylase superfamily)
MSPLEIRVIKIGLVIAPIGGHWGYSLFSDVKTGQPHHYLHHTKFSYNFGAGFLPDGWVADKVMGTTYEGKETGQ